MTMDQPVPQLALLADVLAELAHYGAGSELSGIVDRMLEHNAVELFAAIAARRAYHRTRGFWSIIEHLDRFFRFAPSNRVTMRARAIFSDVRSGKIDLMRDDGWTREELQNEIDAMAEDQPPLVRCVAEVARLACWFHESLPENNELCTVHTVGSLAGILADAFGERAAREFADSFATLGGAK